MPLGIIIRIDNVARIIEVVRLRVGGSWNIPPGVLLAVADMKLDMPTCRSPHCIVINPDALIAIAFVLLAPGTSRMVYLRRSTGMDTQGQTPQSRCAFTDQCSWVFMPDTCDCPPEGPASVNFPPAYKKPWLVPSECL